MKYPKEVLATSKSGKKEARILVERGEYAKYAYFDPETGKNIREGKESIMLKSEDKKEHLFIIPMKQGKSLLLRPRDADKPRKLWDGKKVVEMF